MRLSYDGPLSGPALAAALGVSPATVSRHLANMQPTVLRVGQARATKYAARRGIPPLPGVVPVYELGVSATCKLGDLQAVQPRGFHFSGSAALDGFYPDLPWFLNDARPNGFLGRLAPRQHPHAQLPTNILFWSGDHVLRYLHDFGVDIIGNLVVGDPAFSACLAAALVNPVIASERERSYPELAAAAAAMGVPGSSAGGEQPKFLATRVEGGEPTCVLVKFSPPNDTPVGRRIGDLLRLEHLALGTVAAAGIPAAVSTLVEAGGRVFLEVERFDRVGATGRRGLVSLATLDDEFVGSRESWTLTAERLGAQGRVTPAVVGAVRWLDRFGAWIANSDRHHGNLSCFLERGRVGGLAPVYDMLPMLYAPVHHEVPMRPFQPRLPDGRYPEIWRSCWRAALQFWQDASELDTIDPGLRAIAGENAASILELRGVVARLG